ncbi:MAG: hypothetical protein JNJ46_03585 [Myxococcales bacterium]|nr:hypothetical protein [Myxococcales bacterium]
MQAPSQTVSSASSAQMADRQHATRPAWLGRSSLRLLLDVIGGPRQNWDKLVQLVSLVLAFFRPSLVRSRLARLRQLGHIQELPTNSQLLVAARDQMMLAAAEETKVFYRSQGIPWVFHNVRRFLSGPATMLDPVGLFSPRDAIIHHVLQTFHRHPIYDVVLLRAHPQGEEEMERQAQAILDGNHPHQRALSSLIEDGSYHARLIHEVRAIRQDPYLPARPIPANLLDNPNLMIGMDQFKDLAGFTRYAARLRVGPVDALRAWLYAGWNAVIGDLLWLGPKDVRLDCCDPEIVAQHAQTAAQTA